MCGIAGIFNVNGEPVSPVVLRRMTDVIAHRGPDGEGFYVDRCLGLGHRRLSIIDLSAAGHQPMMSADGHVVLTYNGEIYNFQELRLELEALGHQFRSRTDSEVLLNAWAQWGTSAVARLNGMFAFAVWDRREQSLFIARDRYGIKPLYYARWGRSFVFASEQKSLLKHPDARGGLDVRGLAEYLTFQNIFTDRTIREGIRLLPPASIGRVALGGEAEPEIQRYWDYSFEEPERPETPEAYREELDRLLRQAVSRQLVSDVELGSFLSGGMDSGTLTALAARELRYIKTFTCGFDVSSASGIELAFDERAKAEGMSARFKTEHYEMVLKAGDMERCLPKLVWHIEEPRIGQSYPNYYAAQLASKFVKVVLSGAGGDEMFGGYPWRYHVAVGVTGFDDFVDRVYQSWQRLFPSALARDVLAPIRRDIGDLDTREIVREILATPPGELRTPEDYLNRTLYFEARTFLHGLFVVDDKLSMAHGLEMRVPFMDNDLVDFAMRCPARLKVSGRGAPGSDGPSFRRTRDGKQILRDVMRRYIPEEIAGAEKQGFSAPDASWFKGESMQFVRRRLMTPSARIYDWLDRATVQQLVLEHLNGVQNRRLLIWSLLSLEEALDDSVRTPLPPASAIAGVLS